MLENKEYFAVESILISRLLRLDLVMTCTICWFWWSRRGQPLLVCWVTPVWLERVALVAKMAERYLISKDIGGVSSHWDRIRKSGFLMIFVAKISWQNSPDLSLILGVGNRGSCCARACEAEERARCEVGRGCWMPLDGREPRWEVGWAARFSGSAWKEKKQALAAKQKTREAIRKKDKYWTLNTKSIVDLGGLFFDTIGKCLSFDLLPTYLHCLLVCRYFVHCSFPLDAAFNCRRKSEQSWRSERLHTKRTARSLGCKRFEGQSLPFANRDDSSHLAAHEKDHLRIHHFFNEVT